MGETKLPFPNTQDIFTLHEYFISKDFMEHHLRITLINKTLKYWGHF